ncbi:penicillin-binding transpeptidase domain-containing protein [Cohaesibacter gelatinilyticus]|uniref:Penicillin binding protein transpeptidase domain-containing protein n=1 Tax=Cohaesibacter gelatinilyticus TaxID=372072 RepID=A0A285PEC5_9HYPH|nr:penicillin-binding transpeptidase domain-containing protein [Cohaesibacter gelatinilyticus]SNZ20110.1 Penicillin binding protein transpeptidase domain-containing protein [Cohaesibacter gelatinilyticus]
MKPDSRSSSFRLLTSFIVLAILISGGVFLFFTLVNVFGINKEWHRKVIVPTASKLGENSFARLLNEGAIWVERSSRGVHIKRASCNSYYNEVPQDAELIDGPAGESRAAAVRELCQEADGERLRSLIDVFNASNQLIAIRDNRAIFTASQAHNGKINCTDNSQFNALFVKEGCLKEEWEVSVSDVNGGGRESLPRHLQEINQSAISLNTFAFLADLDKPFMSDWSVTKPYVSQSTGEAPDHFLQTEVLLDNDPWFIDLIGEISEIDIEGKTIQAKNGAFDDASLKFNENVFVINAQKWCSGKRGQRVSCNSSELNSLQSATTLIIESPARGTFRIKITTQPSNVTLVPSSRTNGLETWNEHSQKIGRLRLSCSRKENIPSGAILKGGALEQKNGAPTALDETGCKFAWSDIKKTQKLDNSNATKQKIGPLKQDGVEILDKDGVLTPTAFSLGFSDILGFGVHDAGSLSAALVEELLPKPLKLTIEPKLQVQVSSILAKYMKSGTKYKNANADIILLDAEGDDAGDILAFASTPRPATGLSHWDLLALNSVMPEKGPFAAKAWRAHNIEATPGSTFKLVSSLAGIQHVLDNNDRWLEKALLGKQSSNDLATKLGLSPVNWSDDNVCVLKRSRSGKRLRATGSNSNGLPLFHPRGSIKPIYCMKNYSRSTPLAGHAMFGKTMCRPGNSGKAIGMCEAIIHSSNLFFAGLALKMDGDGLRNPSGKGEHFGKAQLSSIAKMADRLFSSSGTQDNPAGILEVPDPEAEGVPRVQASKMWLAVSNPVRRDEQGNVKNLDRSRLFQMAQSGIGQSVRATPLNMASVAASIATERVVRPRFIAHDLRTAMAQSGSNEPVIRVPDNLDARSKADWNQRYHALWQQLRRGMNGVAKHGTAQGKIRSKQIREHLYSKTGTATLVEGIGAWYVGFLEPPGGDSKINETIAFACRIYPLDDGGGGTDCAPLINQILTSLHKRWPR